MKFFNPAGLLPSAEAAITPPPQNNTSNFLISSALQEASKVTQKYFDVKALKKETEGLAGYVENTSPELAEYLRQKATNYNLGTTDPASERANLIKGITELHGMELNKQKADNYSQNQGFSSMYAAKLRFAQQDYAEAEEAYQNHERNEDKNEAAHNARANTLATNRLPFPPPYQRKPNPYGPRRDRARQRKDAAYERTPDMVQTKGGSNSPFNPIESTTAPGEAANPAMPVPGASPLFGGAPASDDPNVSINPANITPLTDGQAPPNLATSESGAGAVVPDNTQPPVSPNGDAPALSSNPSNPVTQMTPGTETYTPKLIAEKIKQQDAAAVNTALADIDRIKTSLSINKEFSYEPKIHAQLTEMIDKAKQEVFSLPDPGSEVWANNYNRIVNGVKKAIDDAPKIPFKEVNDRRATANMKSKMMVDRVSGQPIEVFIIDASGGKVYKYKNKDGVLTDMTTEEYKLLSEAPNSSTTQAPSSIGESLNNLVNGPYSSLNTLNQAKQNAK